MKTTSRGAVAAKVRAEKRLHPERFCAAPRCLWRLRGKACPRHGYNAPPAPTNPFMPLADRLLAQLRREQPDETGNTPASPDEESHS